MIDILNLILAPNSTEASFKKKVYYKNNRIKAKAKRWGNSFSEGRDSK